MARAWASILAAVGSERMKLQLLQPRPGVSPTPLSSACAGVAADVAATTASGTATSPATIARMSLLIGPPRPHQSLLLSYVDRQNPSMKPREDWKQTSAAGGGGTEGPREGPRNVRLGRDDPGTAAWPRPADRPAE